MQKPVGDESPPESKICDGFERSERGCRKVASANSLLTRILRMIGPVDHAPADRNPFLLWRAYFRPRQIPPNGSKSQAGCQAKRLRSSTNIDLHPQPALGTIGVAETLTDRSNRKLHEVTRGRAHRGIRPVHSRGKLRAGKHAR